MARRIFMILGYRFNSTCALSLVLVQQYQEGNSQGTGLSISNLGLLSAHGKSFGGSEKLVKVLSQAEAGQKL